jgi:hypothetical protein
MPSAIIFFSPIGLLSAMPSSMTIVLKKLAEHVAANLEERAFCVVFENDLNRCWPRRGIARSERQREIQNFAESQGWAATIIEGEFGSRAIFFKRGTGSD